MADRISVKVDVKGAQEWFDSLQQKVAGKVAKYWIADVGRRVFAAVREAMVASYTVKKSDIGLKLSTSNNGISAIISGSKRQSSLSKFSVQQIDSGVVAEVRRGQSKYYDRAFLKTVKTPKTGRSYKGVFISVKEGGRWRLKSLYWSTSFGSLLKSTWIQEVVSSTVNAVKEKIFKQKINDIGLK